MFCKTIPLLLLLTSIPANAFSFNAADGTHWELDVPPGWHVIDAPDGLAEGIHLRLGSSPTITSDNPAPQTGEALIIIDFISPRETGTTTVPKPYGGTITVTNHTITNHAISISVWNNGNTNTNIPTKTILNSLHTVKP